MDDTTYSGIMLVTTTPHPNLDEAEFNAWYDNIHISEIRARVAGIEAVERFCTEAGEQPPRYLTVYRISRPAPAILADMRAAGLSDSAPMLDMLNNPPTIASYDALA
ncbi:hypothetical protein [Arthrobacter sp.]|uniref:hypothetical protein n=1 Tax=Arthrobacter sp. TaxID=1667 RepID=UPI002811690A|nr:hypothetical protein [Arthrobacter sp.]